MVRKPRSANLTHEQKRLICLHARQFPKTTQAQLGQWAKEQFNLNYVPSQAAMSYLLKKRAQFELVSGEGRDYKKMRTVKCPEVDAALANWFLYCQVTTESGAEIVPDNRTDDKLDAQIQALLKRLKLVSPMRLVEVVSPSAEKACDEDLTDADFADSALHVTQGSVGMQVSTADLTRHVATTVSANSSGSSTPFESRADYPGFEGSLDDSWLEWSASQRAAVRQPISDLEAVQTTIRLATEMNCDPVVMMELNRIQSEVANRDPSASSSSTQTAPSQTTARGNASICQFRFGAPTRRLL
ncbi:hypothetical protein Pcac1_g10732 [Phytophthora cactorum]|nr:hypothetical protein Pcac1_g10732 [Phytophthora cactorum]KAG2838746.1 hypothetical protein PC111_g4125 [Phytophthora cactorum]